MSLQTVVREESAPVCDYCGKEVRYYSVRQVSVDILKNNDQDYRNTVTKDTPWVFWWTKKKQVFGTHRYDFHGDCFVKLMERLDELNGSGRE